MPLMVNLIPAESLFGEAKYDGCDTLPHHFNTDVNVFYISKALGGICSQRDARTRPAFFSFVIPRNEESLGLPRREIPRTSE